MNNYKSLQVWMNNKKVGTLAMAAGHIAAFEYDDEWLRTGYSISPFSLPLEKRVFLPKSYEPFEGMFGVFADSLPDGWGRLLIDRLLIQNKINPAEVGSLNRLAIVGKTGMGALEYQPEDKIKLVETDLSLRMKLLWNVKKFLTRNSQTIWIYYFKWEVLLAGQDRRYFIKWTEKNGL